MKTGKRICNTAKYGAFLWGLAVVIISWISPVNGYADIAVTRHNLSAWSPYAANVGADPSSGDRRRNRICVFCHTPHNADSTQVPLWGHMTSSVAVYTVVSTVAMGRTQPNGISKKCLSCHDGTVAIGALINGDEIAMTGSDLVGGKLASGTLGYIGTDLTAKHTHPVSFNYSTAAYQKQLLGSTDLELPLSDYNKKVMLDGLGRVQCSSCHDPHNDACNSWINILEPLAPPDAAPADPLWRKPGDCQCNNASVCGSCHTSARDTTECDDTVYTEYFYDPICDGPPM